MDEHEWLAERFEANRSHLQAVAYRMLGSLRDADDAVQEAWLRLSRADTTSIENFGGGGAPAVARQFMRRADAARAALVDGKVGVVVAPRKRLLLVLRVTVTEDGKIAGIAGMADPARLQTVALGVFED